MSATLTQHPLAIRQLAEQLGLNPDQFIDESHVGRRGFFRYGRKTADACRYCVDGDQIIGLSLRGQNVSNLDWLKEEAFSQLEDLLLGENNFTNLKIPTGWTNLRRVDLSNSPRLRRVAFSGAADQLERLEITDSGLTQLDLPASGCPELQLLDLSRSEIKKLTLSGLCSSIHSLHLRAAAQLQTLTINSPLPALDTLELIGCVKLREIPGEVVLNSPLERLYLSGCIPRNCPSYLCANDSLEGVRVWFRELAKGSGVNKRVKLLISGNGDVGKSTIQCALDKADPRHDTDTLACDCKEEHQTTHGILIGDFTHDDITFSYWDFGGQDIYGATHQLFFADEAVQLLVFDPRYEKMARNGEEGSDRTASGREQKHQIQYFHAIQREKSQYDTFVLVQNKHDKTDPNGEIDYTATDANLLQYAREHLNGRLLHVDALSSYNIDELLNTIVSLGKELPRYEMRFPLTWLKVRQWFIDNDQPGSDKKQRITARYFEEEICARNGVAEADARNVLLEFLESAGYCYVIGDIRWADEEGEGSDIIVDQEWALEAIYRPLHREDIAPLWERLKGRIPVSIIYDAFGPGYRAEDKQLLLNFMEDNALCFRTFEADESKANTTATTEKDYVYPAYLPPNDPETLVMLVEAPAVLRFRAPIPFLNRTDFQRFLCQLGRKVDAFDHLSRYGIFLKTDEGRLGARINYADRCYEVFCEPAAAGTWLKSLLDECPSGEAGWEIAGEAGYVPFDVQAFFGHAAERKEKDLKTDLLDRISTLTQPPIEDRIGLAIFMEELEGYLLKNRFERFFPRLKEAVKKTSQRYVQVLALTGDYNDYVDHQIDGDLRAEEELIRKRTLRKSCFALTRRLEVADLES